MLSVLVTTDLGGPTITRPPIHIPPLTDEDQQLSPD